MQMIRALSLLINFSSIVLFQYCFLSQICFVQIKHLYFSLLRITQNLQDKKAILQQQEVLTLVWGYSKHLEKENQTGLEKLICYLNTFSFIKAMMSMAFKGIQVSHISGTCLNPRNRKDIQNQEAEGWGFFCFIFFCFSPFFGHGTDFR